MEEVRLAIIGVGNMGSLHVIMMSEDKVKRCRLTAVCDIKQSRLDWAKKFWNEDADVKHDYDLEYYLDYKDLLKSENVDAILISTPHYLHPVIGIEGFRAGKHVLSEKPIGVYTKKVVEFMEEAKKA
ncbi:MAG: Gfo/Idh/MocA family oxidoreductase, partial [Clostridia bacterium]|nr:Gfo/Idh/MocA family oxidoreductase [Clostridia bacterium]